MKLIDGVKYRSKVTGKIFTLTLGYDGRSWYLYCRDEDGVTKSLSCSSYNMQETLSVYYEKVDK